jgi:hypothetical protein
MANRKIEIALVSLYIIMSECLGVMPATVLYHRSRDRRKTFDQEQFLLEVRRLNLTKSSKKESGHGKGHNVAAINF